MIELLYFTGKTCNVCHALKPKLLTSVEENFPEVKLRVIDVEEETMVAGQHMVFTLPVVIIKYSGKEMYRFARSFGVFEVLEKLNRLNHL